MTRYLATPLIDIDSQANSAKGLTVNAFTAADRVLVVVSPGYFELDSIVQISKTIKEVKEMFNPSLDLAGFLFTMSDPTINSKTSLQILRQTYTVCL